MLEITAAGERRTIEDKIYTFLTEAWAHDNWKLLWNKVAGIGMGADDNDNAEYVVYAAEALTNDERDEIVGQMQAGTPGANTLEVTVLGRTFPTNGKFAGNTRFADAGAPLEGGVANFRGNDYDSLQFVQGGIAISGPGGVGTLGGIFERPGSGTKYALSAAHVLKPAGSSGNGFLKCPPAGKTISTGAVVVCPSTVGGDADAAYVPIALPATPPDLNRDIFMLNVHPAGLNVPQANANVKKVGAVSDYTNSVIDSILGTRRLPDNRIYKGAVVTKSWFAGPGDSGALGLNDTNEVVGVVYYGFHNRTLLMPIDRLFDWAGNPRVPADICWNFEPVWNW